MLNIQHAVNLTDLNTLHLTAVAANYLVLDNLAQLATLNQRLAEYPNFFILGGGSNLIVPELYAGLVIHNRLKGIRLEDFDQDYYLLSAMAGENWDQFVAHATAKGAYGLENLSLIPGTVGASPVQNIGAYGVEVKDFIHRVQVYDFAAQQIINFSNQECQFSYRNSCFKNNPRYLVLSVSFKLLKKANLKLSYGDVAQQMASIAEPSARDLRNCIIAIRQTKLPDPQHIGNAGSFFHNPILATQQAEQLKLKYPGLALFATTDPQKTKLSAGWLIDNLGLKGFRQGNLGIYSKQALVIVNHATANQVELLSFAKLIQAKVATEYSINLSIEPIII